MPGKKKYQPIVSKAQGRALFAKARAGELDPAEAEGKARAARGKRLPERVKSRGR